MAKADAFQRGCLVCVVGYVSEVRNVYTADVSAMSSSKSQRRKALAFI